MPIDFSKVYDLVDEVPKGEVASYGMIASFLPGVGPRQVGSALSHMPRRVRCPWHRIVQSSGAIAPRPGGMSRQREMLQKEGVTFRKNGSVDWKAHRWGGPSPVWIAKSGADPTDVMEIVSSWKG